MNKSHCGTSVCNETSESVARAHRCTLVISILSDFSRLDRWWSACAMKTHPWNICSEKGNKYFSAEHPFEMQTIIFAGFSYLLYEPVSITILLKECTKHSGWVLDLKGKPQSFKIKTPTNLRKKKNQQRTAILVKLMNIKKWKQSPESWELDRYVW